MRSVVQAQLAASLPSKLVDEFLEAHAAAKRSFYLGGLRLSEVEGGRFCEAAFRLLEQITRGGFTPIGTPLNSEGIIAMLSNLPSGSHPDSVRLHIPRALRLVYDIRNKRDAAHLGDGIDPNLQDATLVCSVIDWVLAEFIRLHHKVSADEAQKIVDQIVTRTVPVIEDFGGFLKLLKPKLGVTEHCLVLLYHRGENGASFNELKSWVRPWMRTNLKRTMSGLVEKKDLAHFDKKNYFITALGRKQVETEKLIELDEFKTFPSEPAQLQNSRLEVVEKVFEVVEIPLSEEEIQILKLFPKVTGNKLTKESVTARFKHHPLKTDQLLDKLVDKEFLRRTLVIGGPGYFRLTPRGRDYLIENDLLT